MNKHANQTDIFETALELYDEGISVREIIERFPSHTKEITEFFHTIEFLEQKNPHVMPDERLLRSALRKSDEPRSGWLNIFFEYQFQFLPAGIAVVFLVLMLLSRPISDEAGLPALPGRDATQEASQRSIEDTGPALEAPMMMKFDASEESNMRITELVPPNATSTTSTTTPEEAEMQ